jgi:hypothetical protein
MESLQVDSGGAVATEHQWVKKGAKKPEHDKGSAKAAPEALSAVEAALRDPELATRVEAGNSAHPWQMTVTVDGMTATFYSSDGKFEGAAGRLLAAVRRAAPWPRNFVPIQG